ncbi:RAB7A-interacting MON1-CCZ1 complex subunit 1-like isoform X2 [Centruroides vittatus]
MQLYSRQSEEPLSVTSFQQLVKALLDITYFEENELVNEDFKDEDAEKKVLSIIDTLNDLEELCKDCFGSDVLNTLGIDIAECLMWRKGALCYMYCHTKYKDSEWVTKNQQNFCKLLYKGITYLGLLLSLRQPVVKDKNTLYCNLDVLNLLEKGIFSDCHMLALMYGGEMCHWYVKHTTQEDTYPLSIENAKKMGLNFLQKYTSAVNGPLKQRGWNAEKANKLINSFTWT